MTYTKEDFIKAARTVHGITYNYALVKYKNAHTKVTIKCKKKGHGSFEQAPMSHLKGSGCPICAQISRNQTRTLSTEEFVRRAKEVHGTTFKYAKVRYTSSSANITITCKKHGDFQQRPNNHLNGQGCPKCCYEERGARRSKDLSHFLEKAKEVHGNLYDYSKTLYEASKLPVKIKCRVHGMFEQTPNNHLRGQHCPKCQQAGYSKLAIQWIEEEARKRKLKNVQHAKTAGEYRIPGTKLRVDGYHAKTNTVFEFHGDCWHGNPSVFKPTSRPHPFNRDLTAKQLYLNTMEREYLLKSLGYKVVSIWEHDYKNR